MILSCLNDFFFYFFGLVHFFLHDPMGLPLVILLHLARKWPRLVSGSSPVQSLGWKQKETSEIPKYSTIYCIYFAN